jgi:hypothetical protein
MFLFYVGGYQRLFNDAPAPPLDGPITFVAPELPEETLLEVTVLSLYGLIKAFCCKLGFECCRTL